jgi:methionyl-tRNA formyltransferase
MTTSKSKKYVFAFFGTDAFSVTVLEQLKASGILPTLVVTAPDRKQGRGMQLTAPAAKVWAESQIKPIPVFQPEVLNHEAVAKLSEQTWDFFIVTSYGIIVPQTIIDIPAHGILNVHPSLLPKHRGATPIETAMMEDEKETGVTVMLVDKKMDHGPILTQEFVSFKSWPAKPEVSTTLAEIGGALLAETIPLYLSGDITPQKQDHSFATFTKKIKKQDGELSSLDKASARENYLKYLALQPWPGTFFFDEQNKRIKITKARYEDDLFVIEKVIPEGKKEQDYTQK